VLRCLEGDTGVTQRKQLFWIQSIPCVCKEDKASRDGDKKGGRNLVKEMARDATTYKASHKGMVLRVEEEFQDREGSMVGWKRKERQRSRRKRKVEGISIFVLYMSAVTSTKVYNPWRSL
jgi:hypothetical protein